jgi:two-component system, OmpR family, alkaline phosphatase synthesis response regulator PhoP
MSSPAPPARPARVLIAEDNPQGAELVEAYLAETDYAIETAADGEEALRKALADPPDLVLLDIMMPRLSGFEVCKQLRADPRTAGVAVLMITALDQPSDVEKAVEAGCDDFLTKPLNKTELLVRVRALLKSRRRPHEPERLLDYIDAVQEGG